MKKMRKIERAKDAKWALDVMQRAPYITVSFTRPDNTPYGLPLSLACKDDTTFYCHCAPEGEKIECIRHNPIVSLSAVSKCAPKFEEERENFTVHYNSAIAVGKAEIVTSQQEKIEALRLICERFLPKFMNHFDAAINRSLARTTIIKITLTEPPVGKCKS